jgi:membrane protein
MKTWSSLPASPRTLSRHVTGSAPRLIQLIAQAVDNFLWHEMSTYAAALAYRGLLALFPFVIFVLALANAADASRLFGVLGDWAHTVPEGQVPAAIRNWMLAQVRGRADGAAISVGALAAIWAVASGARVLRSALNTAAEMPEVQPAWLRVAVSFVAAPVLGTAILAAFALFVVTRRFLQRLVTWFDVNDLVLLSWDWLRLPLGVLLIGAVLSTLYQFGPSRRQPLRSVLPGTLLAAVTLAAASLLFSTIVLGVLQLGVTYGSFSAAIVLLIYLHFAAACLLAGAELNAALASGSDRARARSAAR